MGLCLILIFMIKRFAKINSDIAILMGRFEIKYNFYINIILIIMFDIKNITAKRSEFTINMIFQLLICQKESYHLLYIFFADRTFFNGMIM